MRLLVVAVVCALAAAGLALFAHASGKQIIRYQGIYCDTGTSNRGTRSVVCRPHDGNGYTVLMNAKDFAVVHCGSTAASCRYVLIRPNK